jgi:hypothetical protein
MFFLATRLPYSTFLKLAQECPYDFSASEAYVRFNHIDDTIPNHILAICRAIPIDPYATDDLRQFLNRYPQKVIGEGRWIQYLALEATNFFNEAIVKKIIEFMPMDLVPYIIEFLLPEDQLWFLNPSLEAIFSKNIDKFSPQVQGWLTDNLDKWFNVKQNIVHTIRSIWQAPRKGLNAKLTLFDETQILLNLFKKRNAEVQSLSCKLVGKPGFAKVDFLAKECLDLESRIDPWLKKIDQIDLSPICDSITSEPLTGRVYSLEGKGWILEKTKVGMQISPYSRHPFVNDEEKDQKLPPLTSQESAELEERRLRTNCEIDALRTLILAEHIVDKHHALSN